tara:strand:- start:267 stop:1463 length:1197 start_codon:yes stop_codon:yes gene_type:complete
MATLSSKMLPAGVATLAQGARADTSVQPNDSPAFDGLTVNGNAYPSAGALSNRNLIINGAMTVSQRGNSFPGLTGASQTYTTDRWYAISAGAPTGVFTITKDTDAPDGFASSLKWNCTTADVTLGAADYVATQYRIEGQDLQHLNYGSPAALETTLSFWVKSNKTGSYAVWVFAPDGTRQYQIPYTIDVANTWEQKTGVIPADTSGTINNDTGSGLLLSFGLGAGTNFTSGTAPTAWEANLAADNYAGTTVNLADTIGNTWLLTGVQLEIGAVATPFEHRSFGQELALCQRYYQDLCGGAVSIVAIMNVAYYTTTGCFGSVTLPVEMRAAPTGFVPDQTVFKVFAGGANNSTSAVAVGVASSRKSVELTFTTAARTVGDGGWVRTDTTAASIRLDAEL